MSEPTSRPRLPRIVAAALIAAATSGCFLWPGGGQAPAPAAGRVAQRADTVRPTLPAESLAEARAPGAPNPVLEPAEPERLVSLSAVNADVRPLIIGIAREAGIDLVVTTDVDRRVSINLKDVTPMAAITAIAEAANLTVAVPKARELPSVVFYQLPVDINKESAATIAARFGVSLELARFIVESRRP